MCGPGVHVIAAFVFFAPAFGGVRSYNMKSRLRNILSVGSAKDGSPSSFFVSRYVCGTYVCHGSRRT
jgi:hypothetical protein